MSFWSINLHLLSFFVESSYLHSVEMINFLPFKRASNSACPFSPPVLHYFSDCTVSVRIWSFSYLYISTFGRNTKIDAVDLRIQSKCGKIRTKIRIWTLFTQCPFISLAKSFSSPKILFNINKSAFVCRFTYGSETHSLPSQTLTTEPFVTIVWKLLMVENC